MDYKKLLKVTFSHTQAVFFIFILMFAFVLYNEYPHFFMWQEQNNNTVIEEWEQNINWQQLPNELKNKTDQSGPPYLECPAGPPHEKQVIVTRWYINKCEVHNLPFGKENMEIKNHNGFLYWVAMNLGLIELGLILLIMGSAVKTFIFQRKESFIYKTYRYILRVGDTKK